MAIKAFPFEFVEFKSREFCGRSWIPSGDGVYDEVEDRAQFHADLRGVEIDVIGCSFGSGNEIFEREREGVRIRPRFGPGRVTVYESAFGPVED